MIYTATQCYEIPHDLKCYLTACIVLCNSCVRQLQHDSLISQQPNKTICMGARTPGAPECPLHSKYYKCYQRSVGIEELITYTTTYCMLFNLWLWLQFLICASAKTKLYLVFNAGISPASICMHTWKPKTHSHPYMIVSRRHALQAVFFIDLYILHPWLVCRIK